jgi:nucleoside-diphosphate-sugar epimerase
MLDKYVSHYTLSKQQFREWLAGASQKISAINISLEHFYGPGDDNSKFVTYIIQSLVHDVPSIPLTMGEQRRDFVFIDDVINAFICILNKASDQKNGYQEYEVGSGNSMSIKEMVTLTKSLSKNHLTRLEFGALPYRPNEAMDVRVDVSRLNALGWRASCDLQQGLLKTIEFERTWL